MWPLWKCPLTPKGLNLRLETSVLETWENRRMWRSCLFCWGSSGSFTEYGETLPETRKFRAGWWVEDYSWSCFCLTGSAQSRSVLSLKLRVPSLGSRVKKYKEETAWHVCGWVCRCICIRKCMHEKIIPYICIIFISLQSDSHNFDTYFKTCHTNRRWVFSICRLLFSACCLGFVLGWNDGQHDLDSRWLGQDEYVSANPWRQSTQTNVCS